MQVMNTTGGPVTIAGVYTIPAGSLRTFEDAEWAVLRSRKAVAFWLERGDLKEIAATDLIAGGSINAADISVTQGPITIADVIDIPVHPLDHDGDGRPGGSLPKAARKAKR